MLVELDKLGRVCGGMTTINIPVLTIPGINSLADATKAVMRALENSLDTARTHRSNTSLLMATAGFASALEKANGADVARAQEALAESKKEIKQNLKAAKGGMEPPKESKISAIAGEVSQKTVKETLCEAMPWGAVVGLVLAFVGGITMITGVSIFYQHPFWEHGHRTMLGFGSYSSLVGLVLIFDVCRRALVPPRSLTSRLICVCKCPAATRRRAVHLAQVCAARAGERPRQKG